MRRETPDARSFVARHQQRVVGTYGARHAAASVFDLYAAFGLGSTDKGINTIDADGVALAAIQGLHQIVEEKDAEIAALRARLAALEDTVRALAARQAGQP